MQPKTASCSCGQLQITCTGDPVRISMCHCLECQKRTGSVFAVQARFKREDVAIAGQSSKFSRTGESGGTATFSFCPQCGSTVYWEFREMKEFVAVSIGNFADPHFARPTVSVYNSRRHAWTALPDVEMEMWD